MVVIVIAFIVGFILGKIKFSLPKLSSNKITIMRKKIQNKEWLLQKYQSLMDQEKDNDHYKKFECEPHFVGQTKADHNRIIYYQKTRKTNRQQKFIENQIKYVDTNYYIKFIGKIPEDELKAIKRNNKLNNILDVKD